MARAGFLSVGLVALAGLVACAWAPGYAATAPRSAGQALAPGTDADARRSLMAGTSVRGHRIEAVGTGVRGARSRILVVGSIHGAETAGHAVIRRLRAIGAPGRVELWTVRTVNPDGVESGTRQNARGVDLNRNFPDAWRAQGKPFSPFYSGPRPLSEPESRAARRLIRTLRPDVTIWYHQALRVVDLGSGADPKIVRGYARQVGLRAGRIGFLPGVVTRWQNHSFPGTTAFVVELGAGQLTARQVDRHASAVLSTAAAVSDSRDTRIAYREVTREAPEMAKRR